MSIADEIAALPEKPRLAENNRNYWPEACAYERAHREMAERLLCDMLNVSSASKHCPCAACNNARLYLAHREAE
jgi:hypothetical protein